MGHTKKIIIKKKKLFKSATFTNILILIFFRFLPISTTIGDGLTFPTRLNTSNMEGGTSYQSIGSRTIPHANDADNDYSDGEVTPYQNGNGNAKHHSPRSTEVVLDSRDRVTIKVRDSD